jgi:uncharacterized repeat protein (TIGR02543 family)
MHRGTAAAFMIATVLGLTLTGCSGGGAGGDTVAVTAVALNVAEKELSIGGTLQLSATVSPADASDKAVVWTSGNAAVATVASNGLVTAKSGGTATITVHTADGDRKASCAVTVIDKFAVIFDTSGGTAIAEQSLDQGSSVTRPADPTRTGYTFEGWFADEARTDAWEFETDRIAGPTTIYAKWTGLDYTLTYNANGGSGSMSSVTRPCGTDITLPACDFEPPAGYVFAGWALTATSAAPRQPGATVTMIPGGGTVYAIWDYAFTFTGSGPLTITGLSSKWPASETSLVIPSTIDGKAVTDIAMLAFSGNDSITALVIPDSVLSIGSNAFQHCSGLVSVNLGAGVTRINTNAFTDCSSLTSIGIPASVTSLQAGSAFMGCEKLASIAVDAANPNYCSENGVVYNKAKTALMRCPPNKSGAFTIPNTVTSVYEYAFTGCTGITSIAWSTNQYSIEQSAFMNCTGLTTLSFPASLRYINYNAFRGCANLKTVTLNEGLIQVRQYAFSSTALISLAIPASATDFQYQGIAGLTEITANASSSTYSSVYGVLYSKDQKTLLAYPAMKAGSAYTAPATVTTIGSYAFYKSILTDITLPVGLTTIADNAFMDCPNIESIILTSTVSSIGMNIFWNCPKLKTVRLDATTPPALPSGLPESFSWKIAVPAASLNTYKTTPIWSQHASNIVSQ